LNPIEFTVTALFAIVAAFAVTEPLQTTSFANRQPDPAFQALETPVFTSDLCKDYPISHNLCIFSFHYGVQEN